eukprot:TRINITY_DN5763_c0_g2_i1.p1 TRINITY_DN5763_c0_g2~~TRINITY_DN5763_c0_g2_i1.p1  ORF type:complete len:214 (+),score=30.19 TRINITY_DN5763_c0_g2_i1:82-723(+)
MDEEKGIEGNGSVGEDPITHPRSGTEREEDENDGEQNERNTDDDENDEELFYNRTELSPVQLAVSRGHFYAKVQIVIEVLGLLLLGFDCIFGAMGALVNLLGKGTRRTFLIHISLTAVALGIRVIALLVVTFVVVALVGDSYADLLQSQYQFNFDETAAEQSVISLICNFAIFASRIGALIYSMRATRALKQLEEGHLPGHVEAYAMVPLVSQ